MRQAWFGPRVSSLTRAGRPLIGRSAFQSPALPLPTVPVSLGKTPHPGFFPWGTFTGVWMSISLLIGLLGAINVWPGERVLLCEVLQMSEDSKSSQSGVHPPLYNSFGHWLELGWLNYFFKQEVFFWQKVIVKMYFIEQRETFWKCTRLADLWSVNAGGALLILDNSVILPLCFQSISLKQQLVSLKYS